MPIDVTIVSAAIGGGVAAIVSGAFAFWNICLTKRSEERRQIRELAVSVALENFKIYKSASDGLGTSMWPLDVYLIHAMFLVSALDGSLKTPEQIRKHLREGFAVSEAAMAEALEYNKEIQEPRRKAQ
jgi:hypothetical protein